MIDADSRPSTSAIQARQREMAAEHILFHLVRHVEAQHPGLIDRIEGSLDHLGDPAKDGTADDEAVREIARKFLVSARKG
jgi:plasmid stabilization system protein ParE